MLLLLNHPYYQNEEEALEFIPFALQMLRNLEDAALFPHPISGASRATLDQTTIVPDENQYKWEDVYEILCPPKKVDILKSIDERLPANYRLGFKSLFLAGKNGTLLPYDNTDQLDELIFYENVLAHLRHHMKVF